MSWVKLKDFPSIIIGTSIFMAFAPDAFSRTSSCKRLFTSDNSALTSPLENHQDKIQKYYIFESVAPKVVRVKPGSRAYEVSDFNYEPKSTDRLDIERIVADFGLSRLEAVEVQALLRRFTKSPNNYQFLDAIQAVKAGHTLSRLNIEKTKNAPFTLVLDIDGTLLDQDATRFVPEIHKSSFLVDGAKVSHVAVNKSAVELIERARAMGGSVVLFSRNNDLVIWEILGSLTVGQKPLLSVIDGVFTSSHMVVPPDLREYVGRKNLADLLRKDLSIIPSTNLILIDDDPGYVLQKHLTIGVKKFQIDDIFGGFPKGKYDFQSSKKNDSFLWGSSDYEAGVLSRSEQDRLVELMEEIHAEYQAITENIEFLVSNLKEFSKRQIVFSPLGSEALALLTDTHDSHALPHHTKMAHKDALKHLLAEPARVNATLLAKREKERKKYKGWWQSRGDNFDFD